MLWFVEVSWPIIVALSPDNSLFAYMINEYKIRTLNIKEGNILKEWAVFPNNRIDEIEF